MLENQGNSVIFYAFYTEDGALDTGLTVTADVAEVLRDGTATKIVNDGACTEVLSLGLYRYLLASGSVDAAAEYVAIFHTADADTDQKDIPAVWAIDRAGTEKLEDVSDIAETTDLTSSSDVWTYGSRTLTQSATSVIAAVSGDSITQIRGDSWDFDIDDLTLDTNKQQFTIKKAHDDADGAALLMLDSATGLLILNGSTDVTASNGSLSYAGTTLTPVAAASVTAQLPKGTYVYNIQYVTAAAVVKEPYGGKFIITPDGVRAVT